MEMQMHGSQFRRRDLKRGTEEAETATGKLWPGANVTCGSGGAVAAEEESLFLCTKSAVLLSCCGRRNRRRTAER